MRELVLTTDEACAATARRFVAGCLESVGVPELDAFDMLMALNEAVTNACRHAYGGRDGEEIVISCGRSGDDIVLTVADGGRGFEFDPSMFLMPDPFSSRGRGFFLMKELMDAVGVHSDSLGTVITLRRNLIRNFSPENHR